MAASIDHARLAFLIACALLTTTIGSFEFDATPSTSEETSLPAVSSAGADDVEMTLETRAVTTAESRTLDEVVSTTPILAETDPNEEALLASILRRLSMRHTALPQREREALVRTILAEARTYDLDPGLVVAVIEVESAGYHLAVSHVGAMGLMQLLPSTGKELALRMGIEWHGDDTLFDPIVNVRLGTAYLSQLTKRYGNVHTALAAYNWGPGRIDRRLRRGASVPSLYITKVMAAVDRNSVRLVSRS